MIAINDVGITISNGQGATILMTGPSVTDQRGRPRGDLSEREGVNMPGFLLHVGATVLCAHGGQAQPTVPNPRVTAVAASRRCC